MATKIFVKRIFTIFTTIANFTQYNMQYVPCNSSLLAQETLFLTKKNHFFWQKISKKCVNPDKSKYCDKIAYVWA